MGRPWSTATTGRTVVLSAYLVALALVGRPAWLAVLLCACLLLVWAAPLAGAPALRRRTTGASPGARGGDHHVPGRVRRSARGG